MSFRNFALGALAVALFAGPVAHAQDWAPNRPIFGQIRYMSSENTARKLRVKGYVQRYTRK